MFRKKNVTAATVCLTRVRELDCNMGSEIQALVLNSPLEKEHRDTIQALVNSKVGIDGVELADSAASESQTSQKSGSQSQICVAFDNFPHYLTRSIWESVFDKTVKTETTLWTLAAHSRSSVANISLRGRRRQRLGLLGLRNTCRRTHLMMLCIILVTMAVSSWYIL